MASDDLKSFKISDQSRQRVDRPSGKGPVAPDVQSVGFPRVEALLESESPDFSGMNNRMGELQEMAKSGSMKEKSHAKKAAVAYERAADLLEHLLATKQAMAGGGESEG
jgi:hypothetical protein